MKKRILIAPLNWGLGHATRCIPIINALIIQGFEPVIASDGGALALLQKEFKHLKHIELPSYKITYPRDSKSFRLNMLRRSPNIVKAILQEQKATACIIKKYHIDGIISDNRLGVYQKHIPCVYITHQLKVLSGNTTWLSTLLHQTITARFDEYWIPDNPGEMNLSGHLGHPPTSNTTVKYIGPLSRFQKKKTPSKYDVMVLLSGPEPQRSIIEKKLLDDFGEYKGIVIFIRGLIENEQHICEKNNITIYNFMTSLQLENAINKSQIIVSRPGYTTIMDLNKLNKNAFFIPTPGQYEQEYLAARLTKLKLAPSCQQHEFTIDKLNRIKNYKGLNTIHYDVSLKDLFNLF